LWEFSVNAKPLTWDQRTLVGTAQTLCGGTVVLGTTVAAAGAALAARAIDRPAGGLGHLPLQAGGLLPLAAATISSGLGTAGCVVGVGALGERRLSAPVAAMTAWLAVATVASALGASVIVFPAWRTTRVLAAKENAMAITLMGMAVLAPFAALIAWHGAAVIQERVAMSRHQEALLAAQEAMKADSQPPKPAVPAPPPAEPASPPSAPPLPDAAALPPPLPAGIPAEPTPGDLAPATVEPPVPADPLGSGENSKP
jgi:hypothetical protein